MHDLTTLAARTLVPLAESPTARPPKPSVKPGLHNSQPRGHRSPVDVQCKPSAAQTPGTNVAGHEQSQSQIPLHALQFAPPAVRWTRHAHLGGGLQDYRKNATV